MKLTKNIVLMAFLVHSNVLMAYTSLPGMVKGGQPRVTGSFVSLDHTYEIGNNDFDVDGDLIFVGYKTAVNPRFAIGGGVGFMLDGELGNNASNYEDGSGLLFSGDLQYTFNEFNRNYLIGTASLTHNRFSFELGTSEIDFTATDLKIGGLFLRKIQNFSIYGGIEATIYSDGDIEYKPSGNEFEVEREDPLSLRLGVALAIDPSIDLRADLYALGEKTFAFAVDFKI